MIGKVERHRDRLAPGAEICFFVICPPRPPGPFPITVCKISYFSQLLFLNYQLICPCHNYWEFELHLEDPIGLGSNDQLHGSLTISITEAAYVPKQRPVCIHTFRSIKRHQIVNTRLHHGVVCGLMKQCVEPWEIRPSVVKRPVMC